MSDKKELTRTVSVHDLSTYYKRLIDKITASKEEYMPTKEEWDQLVKSVSGLAGLLEALTLRVNALHNVVVLEPPLPLPTPPPPVEPPLPPPAAKQKVFPAPPNYAAPTQSVELSGNHGIQIARSNTHYRILEGAFVQQIQIKPGVDNVMISGPGKSAYVLGQVLAWEGGSDAPCRITVRDLAADQISLNADDVLLDQLSLGLRGGQDDGYAIWGSGYQMPERLSRWEIRDVRGYSTGGNGCVRLEDLENATITGCVFDSSRHRGLRLHGNLYNVLVSKCVVSLDTESMLGGIYAGPHGGQAGYAERMQFLECDITHSLQIDPDDPATQLNTERLWVNECTLHGFGTVENINDAESDWVVR